MVTANNVYKRFESKSVMSDSYVKKYVRAKKRTAATPKKCLFGAPTQNETDEFLSQERAHQDEERATILQKYDLEHVPAEFLEKSTSDDRGAVASTSSAATLNTTEGVVFQPRIVSDRSPPPSKNLFSPIEKMRSSSSSVSPSSPASSDDVDATSSDYWQTSKRRRASSREQVECKTPVPEKTGTEKTPQNQSD